MKNKHRKIRLQQTNKKHATRNWLLQKKDMATGFSYYLGTIETQCTMENGTEDLHLEWQAGGF